MLAGTKCSNLFPSHSRKDSKRPLTSIRAGTCSARNLVLFLSPDLFGMNVFEENAPELCALRLDREEDWRCWEVLLLRALPFHPAGLGKVEQRLCPFWVDEENFLN